MASGTGLHRWIRRGSWSCGDRRADAHNIQANHSTLYSTRTVVAGKKTPYAQPLWAPGGDRRIEDSTEIRVSAFQGPICQKPFRSNSGDCRLFQTRLTFNVAVPFCDGLVFLFRKVHFVEQQGYFGGMFTKVFTSHAYCSFYERKPCGASSQSPEGRSD